jgi:hypothetical protein
MTGRLPFGGALPPSFCLCVSSLPENRRSPILTLPVYEVPHGGLAFGLQESLQDTAGRPVYKIMLT